ncbi:MAG: hypothetical protein KDD99_14495, partial [Bacteroidetes bacterium]|nr:hypothetical protein [Bacteroidota bacterium]
LNSAFELAADGSELLSPGGSLTPHLTTILSALAITEESCNMLRPLTDEQLTLESLSILYRYSLLAKKLKMSPEELIQTMDITSIFNPFASISQLKTFIDYYDSIKESGFRISELHFLLTYSPDSPFELRTGTYEEFIGILRTSLSQLKEELLESNETPREILEKNLSKLPEFSDSGILNQALDLVEGTWTGTNAERLTFIDEYFAFFIPASANPSTFLSIENYYADDPLTPSIDETGILTEAEETAILDRYAYVNRHLYPYMSVNLVTEHIASILGLENQISSLILSHISIPGSSLSLHQILQSESLIAKDSEGDFITEINEANFPDIFYTYRLVHKISVLIDKLTLTEDEISWMIDMYADTDTFDLSNLPISTPPVSPLFVEWYRLWRHLRFKRMFPEPEETSYFAVLALAFDANSNLSDIQENLALFTQWDQTQIAAMHTYLGLVHSNVQQDYSSPETYHKLWDCFEQMRLTGVDANTLHTWKNRNSTADEQIIAQAIRQTAKSKYEAEEWLKQVEPIQDELREKQRDALIAFHMEHSMRNEPKEIGDDPNPLYWNTAWDLFSYFLIDVEMNACQLTSRIKQAISSTQMFVQRCFLNLEARFVQVPKDDPDLENSWQQWRWMKNYRIWEANRKVFLYPENYIEPELRDDKSPFFKELENDLMQNEITQEHVEQAFQNYLYKVDEVSRMEVMGSYHEVEGSTNLLHVLARTPELPGIYYYRTYDLNYNVWSSWEKIDIEINGDHAIPFMYNRKLHIFWLIFNEKPMKITQNPPAEPSTSPTDAEEPPKMLEVQLGWTLKTHTGWKAKSISKQKLIHPWERPQYAYHLRPRHKETDNTLWVDIFLTTTPEFNNRRFYDQYRDSKEYLTINRFDETYRPWHSSSFVFDGKIQKLKLRGLRGVYYMNGSKNLRYASSYAYVNQNFDQEGRIIEEVTTQEIATRLKHPAGMHFEYNYLANNQTHNVNNSELNRTYGLGTTGSYTLMRGAENPFKVIYPMQDIMSRPFFYEDQKRSLFIKYEWEEYMLDYQTKASRYRYVFYPFYHPHTKFFLQELGRDGIDGLLKRNTQINPPDNNYHFSTYQPVSPNKADETAIRDIVDFSFGGAYSIYNWEIFFHAPMMIANQLSQNQRFEEAMHWYHYIFDPTSTDNYPVPQRYWNTKPFFEHSDDDYRAQRIQNLLNQIDEFSDQVTAWKNDPFKPHLIARYRPVAYQRNVVMKYIDNLIAWGDQLFRRDTMESINEASLLYMLAYEILGRRPEQIPAIPRTDKSYAELEAEGDADIFGNFKTGVSLENDLALPIRTVPGTSGDSLPRLEIFYFCLPHNEKLERYWDTVEDRLFKIRNCMNIEGVVRQLALFAPPIDPALLVKAAAAGLDLGSVLNDLSVPNPHYRFRILYQTAVQFCSEVKSLGEKLLRVLESKDSESLALLRTTNEVRIQEAIKAIRKLQIEEANETLGSLQKGQEIARTKMDYYQNKEFMNALEKAASILTGISALLDLLQIPGNVIAGIAHLVPSFSVGIAGFGGSPTVSLSYGGSNIASATSSFNTILANVAGALSKASGLVGTIGGYQQRKVEWDHQAALATIEVDQLEKQIAAQQIRISIQEKEEENQEILIENAKSEEEFLKSKFTNEQLYSWMSSQVSSIYFQAYQLAYDMAKKAEKSFRRELGLQDSSYIKFGYWDSLKKGLLSGDKLMNDLYRMEAAYYEQNKRELELTKHISLAQVDPLALMQLKLTGSCTLEIPEWLFDMNYPGHYMRRIKTVSVTIPCITGPYTGINCTMSLVSNRVRTSNTVGSAYSWQGIDDDRFVYEMGSIQQIATSSAQNDPGLFEVNFGDERFLPFEGSGVIGTWEIKLPREDNYFDFNTISDFIIHVQYTSRLGGGNLEVAARNYVAGILPDSGVRLLSLKHEFGSAWHRFLYPDSTDADQELVIPLAENHYPFFARGKQIELSGINVFLLDAQHEGSYNLRAQLPGQIITNDYLISTDPGMDGMHHLDQSFVSPGEGVGKIRLKLKRDNVADFRSILPSEVENIIVLLRFTTS